MVETEDDGGDARLFSTSQAQRVTGSSFKLETQVVEEVPSRLVWFGLG